MNQNGPSLQRRYLLYRIIGYFFLALAFLLAFYGSIVGLAISRGTTQRTELQLTTQAGQLSRQLELAQQDYRQGNYQLALTRLEWIMEQDPTYPGAAALQQQTQSALAQQEATPMATHSPTPADTPTPEATPIADPHPELALIQDLVAEEQWQEATNRLVTFQNQYPNFQREETDRLLYEAYIGLGLELIYGKQVEMGIYYLEQAELLGSLTTEVQDQRVWAELYVTGIAFYEVNWEVSVYYFRQLCAAAPFFHDACGKFFTSLVSYGDQFAAAQDWCPAEDAFREALPFSNTQTLRDKLNTAVEGCLQATPTPTAPITGTLSITNTTPITNTIPGQ